MTAAASTPASTAGTMRAFAQTRFGGVEVLEELQLPVPVPTGSDLLVRMEAVALNPVDTKVRSNWNGFGTLQSGDPVITGWDGAGVVEALGPTHDGRFQPGDAVFFAGNVARAGCQRQFTLVDSRLVGRRPRRLSAAEAAALPLTALTVWEGMLDRQGIALHPGAAPVTVLLIGGAGGVGSNAIQILRRVAGARVIATASRPESVAHCLALGANHVIDHHGDLRAQLQDLGIEQVDQVLHTSEPDGTLEAILPLVAPLGRIVCLLPIQQPLASADLFARSIRLEYELMFTRSLFSVDLAHQGAILDRIADLVDAGVLTSTMRSDLPWTLENLREGHRRIEGRQTLGKIVLRLEG